jgi:aminoglycoside phosphotransferase (APT) family kinase protein
VTRRQEDEISVSSRDGAAIGIAGHYSGMTSAGLPGLDLKKLRRFLDECKPGLVAGPLRGRVIAGGKSNLTFEVTDGLSCWVVRRPPLGHVLDTAHDMSREYRVMSSLAETPVPVPDVIALCQDEALIGAPFYVMSYVGGTTYRWRDELEPLGPDQVGPIGLHLVDTLATLHRVNPASVGLSDFGRPEGFLARQVKRWNRQIEASRTRELPKAAKLHRLLNESVPEDRAPAIVHGDFRLDNVLIGADGRVAAVLDWEMATIGDPITDLALMLAYDQLAHHPLGDGIANASTATGFPGRTSVIALYARSAGRGVSGLNFYLALAFFKLAGILEGIHYRYVHGLTVGAGFERAGALVDPALSAGLAAIQE